MTSAEMTDLVDRDAVIPTNEVLQWYRPYDGLKTSLETTPAAGTGRIITGTPTDATT